ncbi:SDR family oxidoreductase [Gordonia sp. PDNC005]|uniref:SDR family oxidoreductase n=1 Tax=unclassified Gordonia (in: high G+C Gram-positive bacteria) TaxID=2657482 RepID=UPI001963783A|nr:SDR family oxidoreductase [Gordonia sp. PDNC005]QRY62008.1 SDR family oxidoreductase [Gordonia sp. PDNC005]
MSHPGDEGGTAVRVVVFGATGYIGGRLVPELIAAGHTVRLMARSPEKLDDVPWRTDVDVVQGDVTDQTSVRAALDNQDVLYYLVHSLVRKDFVTVDADAARLVGAQAADAGVQRIVYLGGLVPDAEELSPHLASRAEVGRILRNSGVPTAELRAAVILGSGSASFEMLRYLSERLPAMITPRWVKNRIQPIAVRDVLHYLVGSAMLPADVNRSFDIGGPDVLTYLEMMREYAVVADLPRRLVVPVPVLTPWLSAQWVNLVTPVPRSIAVPLMESLVHEVVCHEHNIAEYVPDPDGGLTGYRRAVELALARIRDLDVPTRWSDATSSPAPSDPIPSDPEWSGGTLYKDERRHDSDAPPQVLWEVIEAIGGETGWYSFPLAWSVRGWIDRLSGGVGLRRGRRDPRRLRVGEALDWWRVEDLERPRLLRLRAEMKVPGDAWLELSVEPGDNGGSVYHQRALFRPNGLAGHAYWASILPFHGVIFSGMARNITGQAAAQSKHVAEQEKDHD